MAITTAMIKELREATGAGVLDSKKALESADGDFDKAVEILREKGLAKAAKKASREAKDGLVAMMATDSLSALVEVNCETDFVARTDTFKSFVTSMVQQVFDSPTLTTLDQLLQTPYQAQPDKTVAEAIQETISTLGENIIVRRFARYARQGAGVIEGYVHLGGRIGVLVELATSAQPAQPEVLTALAHDLTLQIAAANPRYLSPQEIPAEIVEEERKIYLAQLAEDNKPAAIKTKIVDGRINKFYQEVCLTEQAFVKDDSLSIAKLVEQTGKKAGITISITRFTRFEVGLQ